MQIASNTRCVAHFQCEICIKIDSFDPVTICEMHTVCLILFDYK